MLLVALERSKVIISLKFFASSISWQIQSTILISSSTMQFIITFKESVNTVITILIRCLRSFFSGALTHPFIVPIFTLIWIHIDRISINRLLTSYAFLYVTVRVVFYYVFLTVILRILAIFSFFASIMSSWWNWSKTPFSQRLRWLLSFLITLLGHIAVIVRVLLHISG